MPAIDIEEERRLFARLHERNDREAEQMLICANLRYVVNIARGYLQYEQPFSDLIQEGSVGLIKALRQFKPEPGIQLVSFAVRWINLEICRFILNNWCIATTDITKEQLHLFIRIRRFKRNRGALATSEIKLISANLGMRPAEIQRLESRLRGDDISLGGATQADNIPFVSHEELTDGNDEVAVIEEMNWNKLRIKRMHVALAALDERSRNVIERRWLAGGKRKGLREISNGYNVSSERIRQIQRRAFSTMRNVVS